MEADKAYRNGQKNNDRQNAWIEHDRALVRVMYGVMKDDTELLSSSVTTRCFDGD